MASPHAVAPSGMMQCFRAIAHACRGTYAEAGAADGVGSSTTWQMASRRWDGLVMEADPRRTAQLLAARRRALHYGAACHGAARFQRMQLANITGLSGSWRHTPQAWRKVAGRPFIQRCAPLGAVLRAEGLSTLHFLSVHVGGGGVGVLRTVRWELTSVRIVHACVATDREAELRKFMTQRGFAPFARATQRDHGATFVDQLYARVGVVDATRRGVLVGNDTALCAQPAVMGRLLPARVDGAPAKRRTALGARRCV